MNKIRDRIQDRYGSMQKVPEEVWDFIDPIVAYGDKEEWRITKALEKDNERLKKRLEKDQKNAEEYLKNLRKELGLELEHTK